MWGEGCLPASFALFCVLGMFDSLGVKVPWPT